MTCAAHLSSASPCGRRRTYFLILVGGLVRASGAGLGCPDWPRCFGRLDSAASAADLPPQFDASQFNPTLMWTEYLNRLLGMAVGFLILATASPPGVIIAASRASCGRSSPRCSDRLSGLAGRAGRGPRARRVDRHGALDCRARHRADVAVRDRIDASEIGCIGCISCIRCIRCIGSATLPVALIVVTLVQVALGTQVRGGVDAALDAGAARDALATVGTLDYLHRDAAIAVLLGAACSRCGSLQARGAGMLRWSFAVLALAALQCRSALVMAYVSLLPAAQVLHLTIASLLLGAETVLFLMIWRQTA